ncbi:hypothetical protein ACFFGV_16270 [Pontibacillus salicampi]|uniref:Amidase n=1 Tax=Pontibacillus salicampi TaxID=1449801 RepID=A0ABV6LS45_9BACI
MRSTQILIKRLINHRRGLAIAAALLISLSIVILVPILGGGKEQVKATWIWDVEQIKENPDDVITFAKKENVNRIYVHVSIKDFSSDMYRSFIKKANEEDMEVFALGGDPTWALKKNRDSVSQFVSQVKNYNQVVTDSEQFAGIHFDIEPYLLPEWGKNQSKVIEQWMFNLADVVNQAKQNGDLLVSGDFPFWIHKLDTPGKSEKLSNWILDTLDSITIMAYRDYVEGNNGIKSIVTPLVEDAAQQGKTVVVGVNVIDTSEGTHTTFYGNKPGSLEEELEKLNHHFGEHNGYAGIAIHDYKHWKTHN